MPIKKSGHDDDREKMDVDFNSNALKATDAVAPPLLKSPLTQCKDILQKPEPTEKMLKTDEYSDVDEEEDPARSSGTLEWEFSGIEDPRNVDFKNDVRLLSDPITVRCLPWKILVVFSRPEIRSAMGMFLQCNADSPQTTWTCSGRATLELLSQTKKDPTTYVIRHTFAFKENDWGYQAFISYHDLFNPENGFVVNKTIRARVHVEADAPHGADWDSKKFTGFVGLKNQGATCYLNSVLQALYCTNALRKAVFQMPTESDDSATSVPLALQRTFFDLQCSDRAVGTEKLTRSFGWTTWDSFMQHDAQELCRVLLDNMENKMKGTDVAAIIPKLFCGKMVSYISCKHVEYESKREEQFYDIQLKVKGNSTVYDAFKEYVEVETLDKDNKYDAGKHGLQEAEKGVKFIRFPPVLYLQLMRFQYDFISNTNVKINDRFQFPYELDLTEYLDRPPTASQSLRDGEVLYTKYFLHAVLVHSGDHHGGHYVVYTNPRGDNKWYQFDDDVVSSCSPKDAIEMNYGDDPDFRSFTNAYMLVYIACDARDEVLCPLTEDMIPLDLSNRFHEEQTIEEQKRREKDIAHEFATVNLLLEEDFVGSEGPELFRLDQLPIRSLRIRRTESTEANLVEAASKVLKWSPQEFRLWRVSQQKPSGNIEFTTKLSIDLTRDNLVTLWAQRISAPNSDNLTASIGSTATTTPPAPPSRLCFFKFFDPRLCNLSYCGHAEVPLAPSISGGDLEHLSARLRKRAGLATNAPLVFYRTAETKLVQRLELLSMARLLKPGEVIYFHVDTRVEDIEVGVDAESATSVLSDAPMEDADDVEAPQLVNQQRNHNRSPSILISALSDTLSGTTCSDDVSLNLRRMALTNGHFDPLDTPAAASATLTYFSNYLESSSDLVDLVLVDKLRKSDAGMLIRVSPDVSYQVFAELVANYLSARPDYLQFFTSIVSTERAKSASAAAAAATAQQQQEMHANANPSPLSNDSSGNGNGSSPNGLGGVSMLISEQARAARASGFPGATAHVITALASAAYQGLIREPPGPPIPSTTTGTLRDFLSLPPAYLSTTLQYTNSSVNSTTTTNQDRPPLSVSRFTGQPAITASPFGVHNLHTPAPRRVYYAHTALPIGELESLKNIQVAFVGPRLVDRFDLALSVPGSGTVADLLSEARSHVTLSGSKKLRLMEIRSNRIYNIFGEDVPLERIEPSLLTLTSDACDNLRSGLRIEEIPRDEDDLPPQDVVVHAAHFNKDLSDTFGVPFTVRVRNQESYSDVKNRIRDRLEVTNEKDFDAWKFVLVTRQKSVYIPNDQDILVDTALFTSAPIKPWLGVEHKPPKRPRYAPSEKSIKIHN